MRRRLVVLLGLATSLAAPACGPRRPGDSDAVPSPAASSESAPAESTEPLPSASSASGGPREPTAGDAEMAALEAELVSLHGDGTPLPDVATLHARLEVHDGRGMTKDIETLLFAGEKGFAVIREFLHECDVDRPKMLDLTHHPQMLFAMLRCTALFPDRIVEMSRYLMRVTRPTPGSFIRREIFNFVPVFLGFHEGRYPELRRELIAEIDFQFENGGAWIGKLLIANEDLSYTPPLSSVMKTIEKPHDPPDRDFAIKYVGSRGSEGLDALAAWVNGTPEVNSNLAQAMRMVADDDAKSGANRYATFFEHVDENIRDAATIIYFEFPRELDSLQRVIEFLNSAANDRKKSRLLQNVRYRSPEVFAGLREEAENLTDERIRQGVLSAQRGKTILPDSR